MNVKADIARSYLIELYDSAVKALDAYKARDVDTVHFQIDRFYTARTDWAEHEKDFEGLPVKRVERHIENARAFVDELDRHLKAGFDAQLTTATAVWELRIAAQRFGAAV